MSNKINSRLIKRLITGALVLTLVFSINGFASVVSDNDGSAFITKAEFDSLKNNFQSQIDQYNTSIDSKIDGAIAAYLSGIQISTSELCDYLISDLKNSEIYTTTKYKPIEYKFGSPILDGILVRWDNRTSGAATWYYNTLFSLTIQPKTQGDIHNQNKTYITKMDDTRKIAAWKGYYENVVDKITGSIFSDYGASNWGNTQKTTDYQECAYITYRDPENPDPSWSSYNTNTTTLIGKKPFAIGELNTATGVVGMMPLFKIASIQHEGIENAKYRYVSCFADFYYDMFSNFDNDRQWGYRPVNESAPYKTKFRDKYTVGVENWPNGTAGASNLSECVSSIDTKKEYIGTSIGTVAALEEWKSENTVQVSQNIKTRNAGESQKCSPIMVGFERIASWSQIYEERYDALFNDTNTSGSWGTKNTILIDKDGKKHISLAAGVPLFALQSETGFKWNISFKDETKNYIIWLKDEPFNKESPHLEINTLKFEGLDEVNTWHTTTRPNNHAYKVKNGKGSIKISSIPRDGILFIKWTESVSNISNAGGGVLVCSEPAYKMKQN